MTQNRVEFQSQLDVYKSQMYKCHAYLKVVMCYVCVCVYVYVHLKSIFIMQ